MNDSRPIKSPTTSGYDSSFQTLLEIVVDSVDRVLYDNDEDKSKEPVDD